MSGPSELRPTGPEAVGSLRRVPPGERVSVSVVVCTHNRASLLAPCIDAVGLEAHGSPATAFVQNVVGSMPSAIGKPMMVKAGVDRLSALQLAIDGVRRGGTISVVGVYGGNADPMPMLKIFDKQLTMRFGQANVHRWFDDILPLAEADDDPLGLGDFATHRAPLADAAELYDPFKRKDEGCVKVVLRP